MAIAEGSGVGVDLPSDSVARQQHGDEPARDEHWHRVDQIFLRALALAPAQRSSFLARACRDKPQLRNQLDALLAEGDALEDFLEQPMARPGAGRGKATGGPRLGSCLGPYRVLEKLGSGGMGTVYLAEQDGPVERRVALKVIRPELSCDQVLARFACERQALALMDHSNVASVFDAGCTDSGLPYVAMEYVPGLEITEHCDRYRLGIRERVELFLQVCDGVQHAHQKGLIHRDLKPSNILVKRASGAPAMVKIIDFGVAKSLQRKLSSQVLQTQLGTFVGTPVYSSPEQIWGRYADTDTRADVYSMGAVLYELVVGAPPYACEDFADKSQPQIAQLVSDMEPPAPALRFESLRGEAKAVARQRSSSVEQMHRQLLGDLSWVLRRCLARTPEERYPSVLQLRRDLELWLDGRPIESRSATWPYRLKKCVHRHKLAVVAATFTALLLMASTGIAVTEFVRAERAAEAASQAAHEAQLAADFQVGQLQAIEPSVLGASLRAMLEQSVQDQLSSRNLNSAARESKQGELADLLQGISFTDLTLSLLDQYLFDRARTVIDRDYAESPLLQARLWQTLADTLRKLGRLEEAVQPQQRALELRRSGLGPDHPLTLASMRSRGELRMDLGQWDQAARDLELALVRGRQAQGDGHPQTLECLLLMGEVSYHQGDLVSSEAWSREAVDRSRPTLGSDHPLTLEAINNLAVALVSQGNLQPAEALHLEALEGRRRTLGPGSQETLQSIHNMAILRFQQGRKDEAELLFREALEGKRQTLGSEHPKTLRAISHLGHWLNHHGRSSEAEPLLEEALAARQRVLGEDHPETIQSMYRMGKLYQAQGRFEDAEHWYRAVWKKRRAQHGTTHVHTLSSQSALAAALRDQGRLEEALALGQEVIRHGRRNEPESYQLGLWLTCYGQTLTALLRFEEARDALEEGLNLLHSAGSTGAIFLKRPLDALVALHESWSQHASGHEHQQTAAHWRQRIVELGV